MSEENQQIINPFAASKATLTASADVEGQRAISEIQSAVVVAKRFPRDPVAAMDRILNACARPTLAEESMYCYSKGGSDITGPSIRLAEVLAQNWGNIRSGVIEMSRGSRDGKGFSEAKTYAWDIETNSYDEKVFNVPHWIDTKQGGRPTRDEREIYELVANVGSRRKRACILAVIPGDVAEQAIRQCELTLNSSADTTPENIKRILVAFEKFGVMQEQVEKRIQRRMEAIQPAQVVLLKKIYASLKDGMSSPATWFDMPEGAKVSAPPPIDTVAKKSKPEPEDQLQAVAKQPDDIALEFKLMLESDAIPLQQAVKALGIRKQIVSVYDIPADKIDGAMKDWATFKETALNTK